MRKLQRYENVHIFITMLCMSIPLTVCEIVTSHAIRYITGSGFAGYFFGAQFTHFMVLWVIVTLVYKATTTEPTPYPPKKRNKGNEHVKNR